MFSLRQWAMIFISQAMGISSFVAGLGLLAFPYINSLVCTKCLWQFRLRLLMADWFDRIKLTLIKPGCNQQDHTPADNGHLFMPRWHCKYFFCLDRFGFVLNPTFSDCSLPAGDIIQALAKHPGGGRDLWDQLQHLQLSLQFKVGKCWREKIFIFDISPTS